jgi:hypothetical protein
MDWIDLAQDMDRWRTCVHVYETPGSIKGKEFDYLSDC